MGDRLKFPYDAITDAFPDTFANTFPRIIEMTNFMISRLTSSLQLSCGLVYYVPPQHIVPESCIIKYLTILVNIDDN